MEAEKQSHPAAPAGEPAAGPRRTFARRIDCAPSPRRPGPVAVHVNHGYGRAPGEGA